MSGAPEPGGLSGEPPSSPPGRADRHRFRRHSVLLLGTQAVLLAGGFFVHLYVGRALGPERYGGFGLVSTLLLWAEIALYGGFLVAVPRVVAASPGAAPRVLRTVGGGVAIAGVALTAVAWAASGPVSRALGDPSIARLFLPAFLDLVPFCLYNVCIAVLDGFSAFERRAACATAYMAAKVLATIALIHLGFGVVGALLGNVLGSLAGLAVIAPSALRLSRAAAPIGEAEAAAATRAVLRQAVPVGAFAVLVQLLLTVDLVVLGHAVDQRDLVGLYLGAATLARGPYFLLSAQAAVLVPLIAMAMARGEEGRAEAALHLRRELRFAILLLLPALAVLAATAPEAMAFVMGERFRPAARVLPALVAGMMALGLFKALATAAMAGARNGVVLSLLAVAVALDAGMCFALVPRFGMLGASLSVLVSASLATGAALLYLRAVFAYRFPWASLLRVGAASAAGLLASWAVDATGAHVLAAWAVGGAAIAAGLWATGEVKPAAVRAWVR